jgi:chromate transporter
MKEKKAKTLMKLFFSTLYISAFTFGGGFVIITFMKKKFVDELHWIEEDEMLDLTAIAQSSPGAIAVNASILVGYRVAGLAGTLVSILGTIIPPMMTLSIVSVFYTAFRDNRIVAVVLKGMQAGVAAVIIDVVLNLGGKVVKGKDILSLIIMPAAFIATYFFGVNVIYLILITAVIGAVRTLLTGKEGNDQ